MEQRSSVHAADIGLVEAIAQKKPVILSSGTGH